VDLAFAAAALICCEQGQWESGHRGRGRCDWRGAQSIQYRRIRPVRAGIWVMGSRWPSQASMTAAEPALSSSQVMSTRPTPFARAMPRALPEDLGRVAAVGGAGGRRSLCGRLPAGGRRGERGGWMNGRRFPLRHRRPRTSREPSQGQAEASPAVIQGLEVELPWHSRLKAEAERESIRCHHPAGLPERCLIIRPQRPQAKHRPRPATACYAVDHANKLARTAQPGHSFYWRAHPFPAAPAHRHQTLPSAALICRCRGPCGGWRPDGVPEDKLGRLVILSDPVKVCQLFDLGDGGER
jgi:hypothetical protein